MLSNINKNIPAISACLVSLGYLNYYFYYSHFDIEIGSYLTPSELIFSFIPLLIPFLVFIVVWVLLNIGGSLAYGNYEKGDKYTESQRVLYGLFTSFLNAIRTFYQWITEKKKPKDWFYLPLLISALIASICVKIFLYFYLFVIYKLIVNEPIINLKATVFLGALWIVLIFTRSGAYNLEDNKKRIRKLTYVFSLALATFLLSEWNHEKAQKVLSGNQEVSMTIVIEGNDISTDSILVFVGKTSEYIFLRDIRNHQNQIFKMNNVKSLTTQLKVNQK